jgi:hypothetical protein
VNLTEQEIVALTDKEKPSAQARELAHLGIPCKPRRDGSLVVLRVHVEGMHHHAPAREPQLRSA